MEKEKKTTLVKRTKSSIKKLKDLINNDVHVKARFTALSELSK